MDILKESGLASVETVSVQDENQQNNTTTTIFILRYRRTLTATFSACLAAFTVGNALGYTSAAVPDINSNPLSRFHLTSMDISIVTSIVALGGVVGGIAGGFLSDKFGRKKALMIIGAPSLAGWILIGCAPNVISLQIGRFLVGFSCGVADIAAPTYVSEISEKSVRGFMGSCHELFVNFGLLFVFAFGIFLHWNWLSIACAFVPVIMFFALFFVPESPRWLLANVDRESAMNSLMRLRNSTASDIEAELKEIEDNILAAGSEMRWSEITKPVLYKPICIITGLMFFQEFSGYGALPQYMVSIFQSAGSDWSPFVQTAVVGVAGVIANCITGLVVDRAGRRVMLAISAALMAISMAGMASFFTVMHLISDGGVTVSHIFWLPVLSLIVYNFGTSLGYGPIPFYLTSELFPLRARSKTGGLSVCSVWLFLFITNIVFEPILGIFGDIGVFWMLAGFSILGCLFALIAVPETRGRSLEEIERSFK